MTQCYSFYGESDASPKNLDEMDSMPHLKFYTKFTSLG